MTTYLATWGTMCCSIVSTLSMPVASNEFMSMDFIANFFRMALTLSSTSLNDKGCVYSWPLQLKQG